MCAVFTVLLVMSGGKSSDRAAVLHKCWFSKAGTSRFPIFEPTLPDFLPAANFPVLETAPQKGEPLDSPGFQQLFWCVRGDRASSVSHSAKQEWQKDAAELACTARELRGTPFGWLAGEVGAACTEANRESQGTRSCLVRGFNAQVAADTESLVTLMTPVLWQICTHELLRDLACCCSAAYPLPGYVMRCHSLIKG